MCVRPLAFGSASYNRWSMMRGMLRIRLAGSHGSLLLGGLDHGADPARELGTNSHRESTGRPPLDRWAEVVQAHQQAHAGGDLEVRGVHLLAAQDALGDPFVDLVEHAGEGRQ